MLGRKAAIQFAQIFNKDWEWLQNGNEKTTDDEFMFLSDEEKEFIRAFRLAKEKALKQNEIQTTTKAG